MKIVFKNILLHENKDIMKMKKCFYCNYATNNKSNYNKHMKRMHSSALVRNNIVLKDIGHKENINKNFYGEESVDIRLKENFKLFVSGPSRCGKTVFVAKLIENIQSFAKQPPTLILYIHKVSR